MNKNESVKKTDNFERLCNYLEVIDMFRFVSTLYFNITKDAEEIIAFEQKNIINRKSEINTVCYFTTINRLFSHFLNSIYHLIEYVDNNNLGILKSDNNHKHNKTIYHYYTHNDDYFLLSNLRNSWIHGCQLITTESRISKRELINWAKKDENIKNEKKRERLIKVIESNKFSSVLDGDEYILIEEYIQNNIKMMQTFCDEILSDILFCHLKEGLIELSGYLEESNHVILCSSIISKELDRYFFELDYTLIDFISDEDYLIKDLSVYNLLKEVYRQFDELLFKPTF